MNEPRAAIFDLDGTLVDNMHFHALAWTTLAERLGKRIPAQRFAREWAGMKNEELLPLVLERPATPAEVSELAEEKESHYRALFRPHLAPVAGAFELLGRLVRAGVRRAIASAAPPDNRRFVLAGLGPELSSLFEVVIGAEDVERGKPWPDLFLAAARAVEVAPASCVAFEDAVKGVQSARRAGMFVVGLTTSCTAQELEAAGAGAVLPDFRDLPRALEERLGLT